MGQERIIRLQDNLRLCEGGTEKGSRNARHREEYWGKWEGTWDCKIRERAG